MTLLICSECEGKVSSLAASCPHCGAPVPKTDTVSSTTTAASSSSYSSASATSASTPSSYRPPSDTSPTSNAARPSSEKPNTESTPIKAGSATKQPLPLNVPLRTYRGKTRSVSVPLLLGIIFLPFIFVWFLLQSGYSKVARVAGFAWLAFVLFVLIGMLRLASDLFWNSQADPNVAANGTPATQTQSPDQTPVTQQQLRPLTLPAPTPAITNAAPQSDANTQQFQPAPDPAQFNQSSPPQSIGSAADAAANPAPADNTVNPFNDTRPVHPTDNSGSQ